jgi:septal ring factor EnvC (AmiA/AmiB activator)
MLHVGEIFHCFVICVFSADLQDQLFTSRDQNLELKKSVAQKEEEIRKRNVQIRKLEQQLKNASLVKDPSSIPFFYST